MSRTGQADGKRLQDKGGKYNGFITTVARYGVFGDGEQGRLAETLVRLFSEGKGDLKTPDKAVKGTVKELADKYEVDLMTMVGFLDGINDSLKKANPIEEMEEDTKVSLGFEKELLYKNMVAAGADWLYNLEEWNEIFDEDKRKALYREQKESTTVRKDKKIYPNDPCPCGSGKKYKKCCGKNA